jgi:hypothetical protein
LVSLTFLLNRLIARGTVLTTQQNFLLIN